MKRALRVLVVDTEETILSAVAAVLRRRGHEVVTAISAETAVGLGTPDVLVTALQLGKQSGLELVEALHASGARPQVVFLTAEPSLEDCRSALRLGAVEFLVKPFRLEELVRAVELPARASVRTTGFERNYPSTAACVETAARDLAAYALRCGFSPTTRARIASVTAELVDNARRHAYVHSRGRIQVEASFEERELVLRVSDEGLGFDPATAQRARNAPAQQQGLARAAALSEDLAIDTRPGAGTRATARFASYRVDFDEDGSVDLSEHDFFTPDLARRVLHALKKDETAGLFRLSPALAVSVGRLLAGPALPSLASESVRS
ncbi:MAG: response regulator [Planctomycetes bacterium]|nr:response regulator [Planctomycetota bacterium]